MKIKMISLLFVLVGCINGDLPENIQEVRSGCMYSEDQKTTWRSEVLEDLIAKCESREFDYGEAKLNHCMTDDGQIGLTMRLVFKCL